MIWTVISIQEDDFEDSEQDPRMPGEPEVSIITLESEDGRRCQFGIAQNFLQMQEIYEGDEWPEDIDEIDAQLASSIKQAQWMDNYFDAIEELG